MIYEIWHAIRPVVLILAAVALFISLKKPESVQTEVENVEPVKEKPEEPVKEKREESEKEPLEVDISLQEQEQAKDTKKKRPKKVVVRKGPKSGAVLETSHSHLKNVRVFYSTLTGTSEKAAKVMCETLGKKYQGSDVDIQLINLDYVDDLDTYFISPAVKALYVMVVPSYETESPLDFFIETIKETYNDFRIDSLTLAGTSFGVFGIGDSDGWPSRFCTEADIIDEYLEKLGSERMVKLERACMRHDLTTKLESFTNTLVNLVEHRNDDTLLSQTAQSLAKAKHESAETEDLDDEPKKESVGDIEDLGKSSVTNNQTVKQMVAKDSPTYTALTKQGYTIVGSHSGVKICRWTKSAMRGRGSCYKFAFYGIKSHLCMETTPSLSCSNKCVFCWRHGTNPVGTTWRWEVDRPEVILNGALEGHYQKIKQMKGIPGVVESRFIEASRVRHCALSLVGEPIFYPYINEFLSMLHAKEISSFLVCNAQHPKELKALDRVTQLYVSIDASNKESLKKVDRPLHRDFWDRTLACLDILRTTQNMQRTVFRLTLVKNFNIDEVNGYADLVERGQPCFVEVKGVTYCGSNTPLTMKNVPFYDEVVDFVEQLNKEMASRGLEYGIAAQHAHSCCILIAHKKFLINGQWHTGIDYPKFFSLLNSGTEFGPLDYVTPTPDWATWGAEEGGFSPEDERWSRKKKNLT